MQMFPRLDNFRKLTGFFLTVTVLLIVVAAPVYAVFDPVNDDTDIFLANPNIPAERPNVLIILDNTANWSRNVAGQAIFINEHNAIATVVSNLSDQFNVGLMLYAETGSPNDNIDGGVARFHVRQMNTQNKSVLSNMVSGFNENNDKGNNNTVGLAMFEAYRYFAGKASRSSFGKVKTDYAGNSTHEAKDLPGLHALDSNASGTLFNSPITDACQSNFIIYISNGTANENADALKVSQDELSSLDYDTTSTFSLNPSGQEGNWADDWAKYMATVDVNDNVDGIQNVSSYVVEVDPVTTGQGPDMTALMKSVAENGNGKYFAVTSANNGQAIVNALNQIFTEVQAVNSVFASTTLPVSVNVRGTNLNQVYIGVFRPDGFKSPRWYGNLKMYQLGFDSATNTLFLADKNGQPAENPVTGFINANAPSFWTASSTFWDFRSKEENGAGGPSDSPDGNLVEKGGAAQMLRAYYASKTLQDNRNVYTCTTGCVVGSSLSATPFDTTNTDIPPKLGLGTVAVSAISAFRTVDVTSLTDTRIVESLSTAPDSKSITVDNNAVNQNVTSLTGVQSKQLTSLTNGQTNITITSLVNGSGSNKSTATATANGHGLVTGDSVTISGAGNTDFNGTFIVTSATVNTFTYTLSASPPPGNNTDAGGSPVATTITTVVTATLANHGFQDGQTVTISGVVPTSYNGTYTIASVGANAANEFSFSIPTGLSPITDDGNVFATGATKTATAKVTSHGYTAGSTVNISGANTSAFNGSFVIDQVIDADTFTYTLPSRQGADTSSSIVASQGSTTVTATVYDTFGIPTAHGFLAGTDVTISGASPSGFNGTFPVVDPSPGGDVTKFTYVTTNALPANTGNNVQVASGISTKVTAVIPGHGFGPVGSTRQIYINGVTNYPCSYQGTGGVPPNCTPTNILAYIKDADTITYTTLDNTARPPATGTITARRNHNTTYVEAFAHAPGHGFSNGNKITIKNADNSLYNQVDATIRYIDADNFAFDLDNIGNSKHTDSNAGLGDDTSSTITANIKTTTATVTAVNHGFGDGSTVAISGATPSDFNLTKMITKVSDNVFTYTLNTAQGDASGSIIASGTAAAGEDVNLINWIRGEDNLQDENINNDLTDVRASIHGDVLHSRPAVVNYNRFGYLYPNGPDNDPSTTNDNFTNNDDVYVFYGSNDGMFRAIKGGFDPADPSDASDVPGLEAWSFIPEEFFSKFQRLRNNDPKISSSNKKPYFADGTIGTYALDADGNNKLEVLNTVDCNTVPKGPTCDKVYLYITMRRGGRFIYALDVTDPRDPKLLWKRSYTDLGFAELGYTWSGPKVTTISVDVTDGSIGPDDSTDNPVDKLVLIMGAGYDPDIEDIDPGTITAVDPTDGSVTVNGVTPNVTRNMGRGLFILDAVTGDIIWQAGPPGSDPTNGTTITHTYVSVDDMVFAMPSDPTVITDRDGSVDNRVYIGDTGGNMWRIDLGDHVADWTVTKLAATSDFTPQVVTKVLPDGTSDTRTVVPGMRKFLFPPDAVYSDSLYDAVLIGSGDREHPFDTYVTNRFYMFKDTGSGTSADIYTKIYNASGSTTNANPLKFTLTESDLFDVTSNCIQDSNACSGSGNEADPNAAANALSSADGWLLTFGEGEKSIGNSVTLNNVTFFNTNQPGASVSSSSCASDLGIARQYRVRFDDATAVEDQNINGGLDAGDRAQVHAGGGYLPSPVPLVVEIDGQVHEGVISGVAVDQPPGSVLNARTRKFWYKEID